MSYCKKCGAPLKPGSSFCTRCGARLTAPAAAVPGGGKGSGSSGGAGDPRPPRRSRAPLWIALGVLLVALAVLAIIFIPRLLSPAEEPDRTPKPSREADLQPVYAAAEPFENEDGTVPEDQAAAAIKAVYAAAQKNPDVLSCEMDEYGVYMEVAEGPDYVYCPMMEGMDAGGGGLKIITLQPYDTENRDGARANHWPHDLDALDDVARDLAETDGRWVFSADVNDDDVTMERILSLSDYQVILWHGHGGYNGSAGYYLCTDIRWSESLADRYGLDKSNCYFYNSGKKIGLRPAFFKQKFPDGSFDNAFIYLATCLSGKDKSMAQALIDKGAAVVFVNSQSVDRGYNLDMLHLIAESYLIGPGGETSQAAIRYLGGGYSFNTPENWSIGDSLSLAKFRYGFSDPNHLIKSSEVYYLCRDGMEHRPYSEWIKGFAPEAPSSGPRQGVSDVTVYSGDSLAADVDFDGLQDTVSASGGGRLQLRVDFGSGGSWTAEMAVDSGGQTPYARLLSFTDGDCLCYAFISENFGSKYGGLYCDLYGQDYLHGGEIVPVSRPSFAELDSWGGSYDGRWVVVVGEEVYSIPEPLYSELQRMAADYGEPVLPIPFADGMCYEIYPTPRSDGSGNGIVLSCSCSSPLGYMESPGTVYAEYCLRGASSAEVERSWFEPSPYYLTLLPGVTPDMVSHDLTLPRPTNGTANGLADGQYWAILYAEDDAFGSHVSNEIDIEDYICFSYEEIAALQVGDTLELSRFMPIWASINYRAYGYGGDPNPDVIVNSIERVYDDWMGELLYINREEGSWDYVVLQNYNGRWRVVTDEDYIPMQLAGRVTLPFADDVIIRDQLTPVMIGADDPGTPYIWDDPYDFFVFNHDMRYFEAQITVSNGVITEIFIPYRP